MLLLKAGYATGRHMAKRVDRGGGGPARGGGGTHLPVRRAWPTGTNHTGEAAQD
jgi:hypothetical protein